MSRFFCRFVGLLLCATAFSPTLTSAQGAFFNTYVATDGSDSLTCSYPYRNGSTGVGPCWSLASALSKVADNGTVTCNGVVTSYSPTITIDRSVTIDCRTSGGMDAQRIVINAPGKNVRLRSLGMDSPLGSSSIEIIAAASVYIENLRLSNGFSTPVLYDRRTGPGKLTIIKSIVRTNTGPAIVVAPQGGTIAVVLDEVIVQDSTYGLAAGAGARVLATRSTFSGHSIAGVQADSGAIIEIEDSLIAMNPTGIQASPGSVVSISNSRINSNNVGIAGSTTSYGNNKFFGNAVGDGAVPTLATLK